MHFETKSEYYQNETGASYVKLVKINTSEYFDYCWLNVDPNSSIPIVRSTDPSYVYSNTETIVFGIGYIPFSVIGAIMNLLVILAILRSVELRKEYLTPSILSMALNDFLFSVYTIPVASLLCFMKDLPLPLGCDLYGFVTLVLWQGSLFNLLEVAILRCVVVCYPKVVQNQNFPRACTIAPIMVWVFSALSLVHVLSRQYGHFGFECKTFTCNVIGIDETGRALSPHPLEIFMAIEIITDNLISHH